MSKFMGKTSISVMQNSMQIDNIYDLYELIVAEICTVYRNPNWTISDFIMNCNYRKDKKNPRVLTFVARKREEGIDVPSGRFNYVIAKKYPWKYDTHGRKTLLSVGEMMEFPEDVKDVSGISIDYYMEKSVAGQMARLLSYHEMFDQKLGPEPTDEEYKKADEKSIKMAKKYIVKELFKEYKNTPKDLGKEHKKLYRDVSKKLLAAGQKKGIGLIMTVAEDTSEVEDLIRRVGLYVARKRAESEPGYAKSIIKYYKVRKLCDNVFRKVYLSKDGIFARRMKYFNTREEEIFTNLRTKLNKITGHGGVMNHIIHRLRDINDPTNIQEREIDEIVKSDTVENACDVVSEALTQYKMLMAFKSQNDILFKMMSQECNRTLVLSREESLRLVKQTCLI
jgi:hypothetical protein